MKYHDNRCYKGLYKDGLMHGYGEFTVKFFITSGQMDAFTLVNTKMIKNMAREKLFILMEEFLKGNLLMVKCTEKESILKVEYKKKEYGIMEKD